MVFIQSAMDCTSASPETSSTWAGRLGGRDFLLDTLPLFFAAGADILLFFAFGGILTIRREHRKFEMAGVLGPDPSRRMMVKAARWGVGGKWEELRQGPRSRERAVAKDRCREGVNLAGGEVGGA